MPMITESTPIAFDDALPEAADVVVIGAGIAGTATAWFLAGQGVRVVLCEKGRVAGEQSSRNWGWVRQQGRDPAELPIMIESNRIWRGLAEQTGEADLAFTRAGCVYLTDSAAGLTKYEAWYETARQHQLDTRLLSKADLEKLLPGVAGPWIGGMATPSDGRGEPFVAVPALARAAKRAGAAVVEGCAVRTLDIAGGRLAGVVTERGRVRCERAVLAGGAWSSQFAANAGIDLPQLAVRSTAARTGPAPDAYGPNVSTPGLALRRRADGGYTVSSGDIAEHYVGWPSFRHLTKYLKLLRLSARDTRVRLKGPSGYPGAWGTARRWTADEESPFERLRVLDPAPLPQAVERIRQRLPQRFPVLAGIPLAEAWAGMIDVTPDAIPVISPVEAIPGFYLSTGYSGHGFGIGPGAGLVTAGMVTGAPATIDLSPFRFDRFAEGRPASYGGAA